MLRNGLPITPHGYCRAGDARTTCLIRSQYKLSHTLRTVDACATFRSEIALRVNRVKSTRRCPREDGWRYHREGRNEAMRSSYLWVAAPMLVAAVSSARANDELIKI